MFLGGFLRRFEDEDNGRGNEVDEGLMPHPWPHA